LPIVTNVKRQSYRNLNGQSMIPKKPAPDLIRGAQRFSEKIMLRQAPPNGSSHGDDESAGAICSR